MKKKDNSIIIKDPLYKQILLKHKHLKFLDSPEFQRLRYIRQTSFSESVYPSATHTRFTHSVGVYHLMEKVLNNGLMNEVSAKDREKLMLAGLLHDVGHGPFSHLWEQVFPHFDHEKMSQRILERMGLSDVAEIINKKHPFFLLLSSTIDMDKLDYMARDSYFAGVSYGVSEVDFIIQHMYVKDGKLVIKKSALSSVEDLITQRVNLFKTVYLHKVAVERDFLLGKIFLRVRDLLLDGVEVRMNSSLRSFFEGNDFVEEFLKLNDIVVTADIFLWADHHDEILSTLCSMFVSRKKFKIVNMEFYKVNRKKLIRDIEKKGYDLKYFFGEVCFPINIVQTPIYVDLHGKLVNIGKVSDLIKFYKTQNWNVSYTIYPDDVFDEL